MKKTFILLAFMLTQAIAFGQVYEISAGFSPYGHWKIRENKSKDNLLSHTYLITKPSFNAGFGWRIGLNETLIDLYYAKETPLKTIVLDSGPLTYNYGIIHHFALHAYRGYTILYGKRVQLPIYLGIGLSYYSSPVPTRMILDFGGRIRIRVYLTNRIAWYTGGYYLIGLNTQKDNKNSILHSGLETGLMYNF